MANRFFTFEQGDVCGERYNDRRFSRYVIVEARNADAANARALELGIYFKGDDDAPDCECCGNRWEPVDRRDEGDDVPLLYGIPLFDYYDSRTPPGGQYCIVYQRDGLVLSHSNRGRR
jgi:hypothetical protein